MWQLPVKCLRTGIVDSLTTARIRLSPPRGMTRSMYRSSFSRWGTSARSVESTSCTAAGSISDSLKRFGDELDDRLVGVERFLAAAEDDRVAALEAQGRGVAGDVGAALVEEQDHADRHAHLLDPQPVGADVAFDRLPDRVDLGGDLLDAVRHRGDALLVQPEPLDQGRLELGLLAPPRRRRRWLRSGRPGAGGSGRRCAAGRRRAPPLRTASCSDARRATAPASRRTASSLAWTDCSRRDRRPRRRRDAAVAQAKTGLSASTRT